MKDHILILDGYNLIHRARGGFQKGEWPIVFNFFRGLRPIVENFLPVSQVALVLEGQPKRQEASLPTYKANRPPAPPTFARQRDVVVEVLGMMPITVYQHPDYEADDVINSLVLSSLDKKITIVSSDSDFTQLLQLDMRLGEKGRDADINIWNWRESKFIVRPDFDYLKWKALRGDATDNIPKCHGMSDNAALAVLNDPIRFDFLMKDSAFRDAYEMNLDLIGLKALSSDELAQALMSSNPKGDWNSIKAMFESFGFRSMLKDSTWSKWVGTFERIGS